MYNNPSYHLLLFVLTLVVTFFNTYLTERLPMLLSLHPLLPEVTFPSYHSFLVIHWVREDHRPFPFLVLDTLTSVSVTITSPFNHTSTPRAPSKRTGEGSRSYTSRSPTRYLSYPVDGSLLTPTHTLSWLIY